MTPIDRRRFLAAAGGAIAAPALLTAAPTKTSPSETAAKVLYESLSADQKKIVCFAWDHIDKDRGLLRTHVSNNWQITKPTVTDGFFTKPQQGIIRDIFTGLVDPEWLAKFDKQMKDDSGGKAWGATQSIAMFGEPGAEKFQFVMTGRHQTIRCDGNAEPHVAFGGPIFYGHAPHDEEDAKHEGNVFWVQAEKANALYRMLDGKQQKAALLPKTPRESAVAFRGAKLKTADGLPVTDLSRDQKDELQNVLGTLLAPFRTADRDEAFAALKTQGGLDACRLSYFADADIGDDKVWDNWRLEGPSFVWHYRGSPHVHVWVNIADAPNVTLNAKG
jgi:hypothetical protein